MNWLLKRLIWHVQGRCTNCGDAMMEVRKAVTYGPDWILLGKTLTVCKSMADAEPEEFETRTCMRKR